MSARGRSTDHMYTYCAALRLEASHIRDWRTLMKKIIAITLTAALALTGSFTASLTKTADAAAYTTKTNTQYTDTYTDTAVTKSFAKSKTKKVSKKTICSFCVLLDAVYSSVFFGILFENPHCLSMQASLLPFSTIGPPHSGQCSVDGFCHDINSHSGYERHP